MGESVVMQKIKYAIGCLLLMLSGILLAEDASEASVFAPIDSVEASWTFSGIALSENGANYPYVFQVDRNNNEFHATAIIVDSLNKETRIIENSDAHIDSPENFNWQIGQAFLRYNPINSSWIFGVAKPNKQGFNFKVDMLNQPKHGTLAQKLDHGLDLMVLQTGQLNGHLVMSDEDKGQFVSARNAWFRQVGVLKKDSLIGDQLNGILCSFMDGSGLYALSMLNGKAISASIVGQYDASLKPTPISQFIGLLQPAKGAWHIKIVAPKLDLALNDLIKQNKTVAGFVQQEEKQGFCMLSETQFDGGFSGKNQTNTQETIKEIGKISNAN